MTTLQTEEINPTVADEVASDPRLPLCLNEKNASLKFGTEGWVSRGEFRWADSQPRGDMLRGISVPWGLLAEGNQNNIQNMPFSRYIYFHGGAEIAFQVNGTPFQQGLLIGYFMPLTITPYATSIGNAFTLPHILLAPKQNSTSTLSIPFRFYRNVLNSYAQEQSLGHFILQVITPLSSVEGEPVSITMYTRFPKASFRIPRPIKTTTVTAIDAKTRLPRVFTSVIDMKDELPLNANYTHHESLTAQGVGSSTSNITNTYNVSDVVGDLTVESKDSTRGNSQKVDAELDVGLDKPMLMSGSVPTHGLYSGMSKSSGVDPCVGMQLCPTAMERSSYGLFDLADTSVKSMTRRKGMFSHITWTTEQQPNTELLTFNLDSILSHDSGDFPAVCPIMILNYFIFWRADFLIEVRAVRTQFHSGRVRATIAYGAEELKPVDNTVFYNHILEFKGENDVARFRVPYNAATEFLRTFEGPGFRDPQQNHSIGKISFSVANQLVAPPTVPASIDLLFFISFDNVHVAVPRPINFFRAPMVDDPVQYFGSEAPSYPPITKKYGLVAQGPVEPKGACDEEAEIAAVTDSPTAPVDKPDSVDQPFVPLGVSTTAKTPYKRGPLHALKLGSKFEHQPHNLISLLRRRREMFVPHTSVWHYFLPKITGDDYRRQVVTFHASFDHGLDIWFAGWTGSINYRVIFKAPPYQEGLPQWCPQVPLQVYFTPAPYDGALDDVYMAHLAQGMFAGNFATALHARSFQGFQVACELGNDQSNQNYIDFNVPFQSHFNFLCKRSMDSWKTPTMTSSGVIQMIMPGFWHDKETPPKSYLPTLYCGVGDDYRLGIYRPPPHERSPEWMPYVGTPTDVMDEAMFGGFYAKDPPPIPPTRKR